MVGVWSADDGGDGAESFFMEDGHIWRYLCQDSGCIEVSFALYCFATKCHLCSHFDRVLYLLLQCITQIATCHRADLRLSLEWIAHKQLCSCFDELLLKGVSN